MPQDQTTKKILQLDSLLNWTVLSCIIWGLWWVTESHEGHRGSFSTKGRALRHSLARLHQKGARHSVSVRSQRVFIRCQRVIPTLRLQLWFLGRCPSNFAESLVFFAPPFMRNRQSQFLGNCNGSPLSDLSPFRSIKLQSESISFSQSHNQF